jgi:hypothetical protein
MQLCRLKAEDNPCSDARVALRRVERLGLQVVRLNAPSHSADQAEVDTSSEIKGKGVLLLSNVANRCAGGNALVSHSEKSLSKWREPADRDRSARAEQVGVQVRIYSPLSGAKKSEELYRYRAVTRTHIAGNPKPVGEPE